MKYVKMEEKQCFYVHLVFSTHILDNVWSVADSAKCNIIHERRFLNAGNKMHTCLFLAPLFLGIKKVQLPFVWPVLEEIP